MFSDISSPFIPAFGGKKHWLLALEESANHAWSYFLKEKSKLKNVMFVLIKNLKIKYDIQVRYTHCYNAKENVDFE